MAPVPIFSLFFLSYDGYIDMASHANYRIYGTPCRMMKKPTRVNKPVLGKEREFEANNM
jgi:hypothetical protein